MFQIQKEDEARSAAALSPPAFRLPSNSYRHVLLQLNHKSERNGDPARDTEGQETEETPILVILQVTNGRALRLLLSSRGFRPTSPFLFSPFLVPVRLFTDELTIKD